MNLESNDRCRQCLKRSAEDREARVRVEREGLDVVDKGVGKGSGRKGRSVQIVELPSRHGHWGHSEVARV
jgi:hypothetical protein